MRNDKVCVCGTNAYAPKNEEHPSAMAGREQKLVSSKMAPVTFDTRATLVAIAPGSHGESWSFSLTRPGDL